MTTEASGVIELSDTELNVLEARWKGSPEALESKLLASYLSMNRCWYCKAELHVETHPHCYDCPENEDG